VGLNFSRPCGTRASSVLNPALKRRAIFICPSGTIPLRRADIFSKRHYDFGWSYASIPGAFQSSSHAASLPRNSTVSRKVSAGAASSCFAAQDNYSTIFSTAVCVVSGSDCALRKIFSAVRTAAT
jgi:hypothetical protein